MSANPQAAIAVAPVETIRPSSRSGVGWFDELREKLSGAPKRP
jgi:hypothetical protein